MPLDEFKRQVQNQFAIVLSWEEIRALHKLYGDPGEFEWLGRASKSDMTAACALLTESSEDIRDMFQCVPPVQQHLYRQAHLVRNVVGFSFFWPLSARTNLWYIPGGSATRMHP